MKTLNVYDLGRIRYQDAWLLQKHLVEKRKQDQIEDSLLLLEHDRVITLGRDGSRKSLLFPEEILQDQGVDLVESDRGGDATYHGPGQLVAYPILNLKGELEDIPKFVRLLEQVMIDCIADQGLVGTRLEGTPGTWLLNPERKIGAVGARISRWITHHGVALNVNTNLEDFSLIVPCGLVGKGVTSMANELGAALDFQQVKLNFAEHFARGFQRELSWQDGSELRRSILS
jgi:lipoyl(octanoyl) transferase